MDVELVAAFPSVRKWDFFLFCSFQISLKLSSDKELGVFFSPPYTSSARFLWFLLVLLAEEAGHGPGQGSMAADLGFCLCCRSSCSPAATPQYCRSSASCPSSISVTHGWSKCCSRHLSLLVTTTFRTRSFWSKRWAVFYWPHLFRYLLYLRQILWLCVKANATEK